MMINKKDWKHYYDVASKRPDLKEFKDLLQVSLNQPRVDLGRFIIKTREGDKTFDELLEIHNPNKLISDEKS